MEQASRAATAEKWRWGMILKFSCGECKSENIELLKEDKDYCYYTCLDCGATLWMGKGEKMTGGGGGE